MNSAVSIRRFFFVLAVVALLSACAARPPTGVDRNQLWQSHLARINQLAHWQARGRVGVRAADDGWNASFDWRQQDRIFSIRISGPFGRGVVELEGNPRYVLLKQAGQEPRVAENADSLLQQQTGWTLPVIGLRYWLLGVPAPDLPEQHRLEGDGLLASLEQSGWTIEYLDYQQVDGYRLPARLKLVNGDIHVKLIASDWQLAGNRGR